MAMESKSGVMKVKFDSTAHGKKIDSSSSRDTAAWKHKSASSVAKNEVKSKTTPSSSKTVTRTAASKVREKKVFSLPGQKFDPPEEREPLRIFYESLSNQIPTSEMAEFWMMEHGLLSPDRAKRAYEKKQKKQKQIRTGTAIKSPHTPSKTESSQKQQAFKNGDLKSKRRIIQDSDDEDDFILSHKRRKV